jgi:Rrf2 family protein
MMKLSTRTRYGTRAMLELARRYMTGPVSAKEIAEHEELSIDYMESLLATLRAAGLVVTVRGAKGGHMLARSPREINLAEIYTTLEGDEGFIHCTQRPERCLRSQDCVTQTVWAGLYAACKGYLEDITLEALARRATRTQPSCGDESV